MSFCYFLSNIALYQALKVAIPDGEAKLRCLSQTREINDKRYYIPILKSL